MWVTTIFFVNLNMAVNIILNIVLAINIIPKTVLRIATLATDISIECIDGVRAGLDILRIMMGTLENHSSRISYVITQAIKSATIARDRSTSTLLDQALE